MVNAMSLVYRIVMTLNKTQLVIVIGIVLAAGMIFLPVVSAHGSDTETTNPYDDGMMNSSEYTPHSDGVVAGGGCHGVNNGHYDDGHHTDGHTDVAHDEYHSGVSPAGHSWWMDRMFWFF